jgi:signal transduction histidine kinase
MELLSKFKLILFPKKDLDPTETDNLLGRGEAFWKTAKYLTPFGFSFAALYYFYFDAPTSALITILHTVGIWSLGALKKAGVSANFYMNFGVAIYLSLFINISFFTGGSDFVNIWWLTTPPVIAISFLSRRVTIAWSVISLFFALLFFLPQVKTLVFNELNPADFQVLHILSICSLLIVFTIVSFFAETARMKIMNEKTDALEAANRASNLASLGEMAGGIAHEINNPLLIISGSSMVIEKALRKEDLDKEKILKHLQTIKKTTKRAATIIKGLKTLARDGVYDAAENVSIKEVLDDVLSFMEAKLRHGEINLLLDTNNTLFDKKFPLFRVQFSQVVLNLLTNSFDAISELEDKWINIEMKEEQGVITLRITDSGAGIPKEILDKIFTPFFTTKPIGKGTGLGLPLCYSIMEKCGGELKYDKENKNTCFALKLPAPIKEETLEESNKNNLNSNAA